MVGVVGGLVYKRRQDAAKKKAAEAAKKKEKKKKRRESKLMRAVTQTVKTVGLYKAIYSVKVAEKVCRCRMA